VKPLVLLAGAALGLAALVGCGPNCQNSCAQVYSQCGVTLPGRTSQELEGTCVDECTAALRESGGLEGYDPFVRRTSNQPFELETDQQAVAWMDCVWEKAPDGTPEQCEDLSPQTGFCAR
jgi:hypothetical protein